VWAISAGLLIAANVAIPGLAFPYDQQRIVQVAASVLAVLACVLEREGRAAAAAGLRQSATPLRIAAASLLGIALASALAGAHRRASLLEIAHAALLVLAVAAVGSAFRRERARCETVAGAAIALALALTSFDVALRIAALDQAGTALVRTSELFVRFQHSRFLGHWLTWALPLLAGLGVAASSRAVGAALLAVSSAGWTLAIIAAGRGTVVAQAVGAAVVVACFGRAARAWATAHLGAAVGGLSLYLLTSVAFPHAWAQLSSAAVRLASLSDSGRFLLWREALAMTSSAPWLGNGPRAFAFRTDLRAAHPHDAVLQMSAELGTPAAMLATLVCGALLVRWLLRARVALAYESRARAGMRAGVAAALVAAAFHSLLCGVLITPVSELMLVLTVAWAMALDPGAPSPAGESRGAGGAFVAAAAVVLAAWILSAVPELARVAAAEVPRDVHDVHLRPRMWHDETSILRAHGATQPARRTTQHP
jgi:O-antigen ligase